ncbi:hypothetical protein HY493_04245 [Candidatus Woesearchaeota archaeon]|nr:hypothetical protein [Candidatus Woesearchaeota archaeon]
MIKELPDIIPLAHRLAAYLNQGLVKSVAGIPDFAMLADRDAMVDERLFKRDLEARTRTYEKVVRCLDDGVAWLAKDGVTVSQAMMSLDDRVTKGDRLFYAWGEWVVFSESPVPQTFEKVHPETARKESSRAKEQRERIAVKYIDAESVARNYHGYADSVPLTSARFKTTWDVMLAADKEGIFYLHKYSRWSGARDEQMVSAAAKSFVAEHGDDPHYLVDQHTMRNLEQIAYDIPAMRTRQRVRQQVASGRKWWQVAEEFADALARRAEIAPYWRVINICGAGHIAGTDSKYFVHEPDFNAEPGNGTENAFRVRHALEHYASNSFRDVFLGNGWRFPERNREFDDYAKKGHIRAEDVPVLKREWQEFVELANKTFREYFTAYRS